jgi:hypothetical protein
MATPDGVANNRDNGPEEHEDRTDRHPALSAPAQRSVPRDLFLLV